MFKSIKNMSLLAALVVVPTAVSAAQPATVPAVAATPAFVAPIQYIYTPTLQKDATELFNCRVVNVSGKDQVIDIAILNSEGKPLESQQAAKVPAGLTTSDSARTKNTIGYCRVGIKGSTKDVLVTFCSQTATSPSCKVAVVGQY